MEIIKEYGNLSFLLFSRIRKDNGGLEGNPSRNLSFGTFDLLEKRLGRGNLCK